MSRRGVTRRTIRRAYLPIVIGPIVLAVCWIALGVLAGAQHASGMFCDLGFELIPYGGLVLAAFVIVVGTVVGWLIDRRAVAGGR